MDCGEFRPARPGLTRVLGRLFEILLRRYMHAYVYIRTLSLSAMEGIAISLAFIGDD